MHVGQPIRSLIPTVDGPVLVVLAGTSRPLTGRRIATLAGASHTGVNAVLARLVGAGIVLAERQGNATLYLANREHLAWPAVAALADLRLATLEMLRSMLGAWVLRPMCAFTFGSFARRDGDEDSDIDLAVVRDTAAFANLADDSEALWGSQIAELRQRVEAATGNAAQLLDLDLSRLREHLDLQDPIVDNWRNDAVHLVGVELATVLSRAQDLTVTR